MDKTAVKTAFSTSPVLTGTFTWVDNQLTFTPDGLLKHQTEYTVKISKDALDSEGINLAKDYQWSFTTVKQVDIEKTNGDGEEPQKTKENPALIYSMAGFNVALVIVLVILLFLFLKKEKPEKTDEPPEELEEPVSEGATEHLPEQIPSTAEDEDLTQQTQPETDSRAEQFEVNGEYSIKQDE